MRCKQCRRKISRYAKECPYCKKLVEVDSAALTRYMEEIDQTSEEKFNNRKKRIHIAICSVSLLLLVLLACGGSYLKLKDRWNITADTLLYIKDDSLIAKDLAKQEEKVITDELSGGSDEKTVLDAEVKVLYNNEQQHTLLYAQNIKEQPLMSYSLYEQNTRNWKEPARLIAEHVRLCTRDDQEALYYVTYDSGYLYKYSRGNTEKVLLPYISRLQFVKEHGRILVICKKDSENTIKANGMYNQVLDEEWMNSHLTTDALYHVVVSSFTEKCVVEDLGKQYKIADDLSVVYYLQNNRLLECKTEKEEMAIFKTNVSDFVLATINQEEKLYYIQYKLKEHTYYDYVKDPYQVTDSQIEKQEALYKNETKKEREERSKRNQLRLRLLGQSAYTYEGALHCYSNGIDEVYQGNVNGMVQVSRNQAPYLYKTQEFSCNYMISKDGNQDVVNKLAQYFGKVSEKLTEENYYVASLYDYNEQTNAIPSPHNVLIMYEQSVYELKDGKIGKVALTGKNNGFSYFDLFHDSLKDNAVSLEDSVKKQGESTYSVEFDGTYRLIVNREGEEKKELISKVEGYKILSDGRIAVVAADEKTNRMGLYCIEQNQTITLVDADVVNLIGEGAWIRKS